jgi:DNA-binding response OmpR family regulator
VVKDQDDERNLLRPMLWEYDVVTANDYAEGLRLARSQYFDLYVLGNRVLNGTGLDLCRRIREFDPNTPIIFYSRQPGDHSEALAAGAQAYFAKPIKVQEVLGAVAKLLTASSQRLLEARYAEYLSIREELDVRFRENCESATMAAERRQRAARRLLRIKAENVFLNAGGARGDFARLWPATYLDATFDWECDKRNGSLSGSDSVSPWPGVRRE